MLTAAIWLVAYWALEVACVGIARLKGDVPLKDLPGSTQIRMFSAIFAPIAAAILATIAINR